MYSSFLNFVKTYSAIVDKFLKTSFIFLIINYMTPRIYYKSRDKIIREGKENEWIRDKNKEKGVGRREQIYS